ncbi:MAG TPA: diaminopimelate epimerase [Atribacteraceae bacterium]|nr:diaminopimelate epimerase [Atribacteraceae bacterium]
MDFVKMQGLGNDFILMDGKIVASISDLPEFTRQICDRHYGVGADGLILVDQNAVDQSIGMRVINSDGSTAEMCGNGIRCLARYVYERGIRREKSFPVRTGAGIITPEVLVSDGKVSIVRVDMGKPSFSPVDIFLDDQGMEARAGEYNLAVDNRIFSFMPVSMGNPHAVIFELPDSWMVYGAILEAHPRFTRKTNVEFVRIINSREAEVKVWERGAGATLACGTGACAVLVASVRKGLLKREASFHLPGGTLKVAWPNDDSAVLMEGPAEEVFTGTIIQANLR